MSHVRIDKDGMAGQWSSLAGALASRPAVAVLPNRRLAVFARGTDGGLWLCVQRPDGWSKWKPLDGVLAPGPVVIAESDGRVRIFAVGPDKKLKTIVLSATLAPAAWESLDGALSAAPAVVRTRGATHVLARGTDAALPADYGVGLVSVAVARWFARLTATAGPSGIHAFVAAADGMARRVIVNPTTGEEQWRPYGGPVTTPPEIFKSGTAVVAFARGPDGAIWQGPAVETR